MKRCNLKLLITLSVAFICLFILHFDSAQASEKALLDKLYEKGILTEEEYREVIAQIEKEEKKEKAEKKGIRKKYVFNSQNINVGYVPGGGFYVQTFDKRFKMNIGGYLQMRYEFRHVEDQILAFHPITGAPLYEGGDSRNTFRIRRARLYVKGNVFHPKLKYKIQWEMSPGFSLRDCYVDLAFWKPASLKFGQYKVNFNREELVSSSKNMFPERSIANAAFAFERDIGLMFHGIAGPDDLLEYSVGMYNGNGPNTLNLDNDFMYVGRVVLNPFGKYGYYHGDVEYSPKPKAYFGVATAIGKSYLPTRPVPLTQFTPLTGWFAYVPAIPGSAWEYNFVAEAGFKWMGFSAEAAYFWRLRDPTTMVASGSLPPFSNATDMGYMVHASYFVIPTHLELAGRVSQVFYDSSDTGLGDQFESSAGINYYFFSHNLKMQAMYSFLRSDDLTKVDDQNDHRFILQLAVRI